MSVQHQPPQLEHSLHSQRGNTRSIGNYILGRTIGEGTFGKVKLARHILSGQSVAVKVLQKDRLVEVADVERVAREVHILKLLRHPHIAQLFEIIETRGQLYLIMEYASGGELFDYIVKQGRVQEPEACRFFHQIIAGIEQIHAMGVVHRDLKPENLLLDEHKRIKIVDFGLSNLFREGQRLSTACGSPCYAPPEMVAGLQYAPQLCDLWSCGVILFALVCGFLPFEDQNTAALYKKILAADFTFPSFPSDAVKELITGLLTVDPGQRFTVAMVRAHRWYQQITEASTPPPDRGIAGSPELDEEVLRELETYGFPPAYAVRCLELNKHNHMTTTYWLLLDRKRKVMEQIDHVMGDTTDLEATALKTAEPPSAQVYPDAERGAVTLDVGPCFQPACGYPPRQEQAVQSARGPREVCAPRGASRVEQSPLTTPRATPVSAWSTAVCPAAGAPAWRQAAAGAPAAAAVALPVPSPHMGSRSPQLGQVVTAPSSVVTTPRSAGGSWKTAPATAGAIAQCRGDSRARPATAGPHGGPVVAPLSLKHPVLAVCQSPVQPDREQNVAQHAQQHAVVRLHESQGQKTIISPRRQAVTPRAYTPQSARQWCQPQVTQYPAPASHRTPSPMGHAVPAGAVAPRPVMASPRGRPAQPVAANQQRRPVAVAVMPVRIVAVQSPGRAPVSRPAWK